MICSSSVPSILVCSSRQGLEVWSLDWERRLLALPEVLSKALVARMEKIAFLHPHLRWQVIAAEINGWHEWQQSML
jgi:hypothetical protein